MENLYPTPIDAALLYASFGWRVVPCRAGSKVPTLKAWQDVATTDADVIRSWDWHGGVCIATGSASGIWVLDMDVGDGKPGPASLRALLDEAGEERMPETYVVDTPSGGAHFYFAYPTDGEVRNDAGRKLGPGLDVRGEGGQVVAPPTPGYAWHEGRALWELDIEGLPSGF